MTVCRV